MEKKRRNKGKISKSATEDKSHTYTAMKTKILSLLLTTVLMVATSSCGDGTTQRSGENSETVSTTETEKTKSADEKAKWKYSERVDEMTDATSYFASITSENYTEFDFPYDNKLIYMTLTVRKQPRSGVDVYMSIPEGQFNPSYPSTKITARFGDEDPTSWTCSMPSDGSTEFLFIRDAANFVKKLKDANSLKIRAEFFQEGSHTFTFLTEGFEWEH